MSLEVHDNRRQHAVSRAWERYGYALAIEEHKTLCESIRSQTDDTVFLEQQTKTRELWLVRLNPYDCWYPVIYDRRSNQIITFLPIDAHQLDNEEIVSRLPIDFMRPRD